MKIEQHIIYQWNAVIRAKTQRITRAGKKETAGKSFNQKRGD